MNEKELYAMAIEQNLAPSTRVYKNVVKKGKTHGHTVRKGVLIAAACLCVAVLTVACIPAARAAVLNWLKPATDPSAYLTTPEEERPTDNPALDAAIESPAAETVSVSVVDAKDATWQAWAEGLTLTLDELLYDGETLHITGDLAGQTDSFVMPESAYDITEDVTGTTVNPPDDLVIVSVRYQVNGGAWEYTLRDALEQHYHPDSSDAREALERGTLPLLVTADVGSGLTGVQTLTLELLFADMGTNRANPILTDADVPVSCVSLRVDGLTFDATAGTDMQQSLPLPAAAALSGDVLVFSGAENIADGKAQAGNDLLSLDGGTLALIQMQQMLTGTRMTFHLTLPASWTDAQCAFASDYAEVDLVIDGENQGGFGKAYKSIRYYDARVIGDLGLSDPPDVSDPHHIVFSVETLLMPEDWARMQSLSALLSVFEMSVYNGATLPADSRVTVDYSPDDWSEDGARKSFASCPLVIR